MTAAILYIRIFFKALALIGPFAAVIIFAAAGEAQQASLPQPASIPTPAAAAASAATPIVDAPAAVAIPAGELNPNELQPLVFSYWEHAAINDARKSRGNVRGLTDEELARALRAKPGDKQKPPPEEREIKLQGIVFYSESDWTIWLNGKRITPDALPKEALDLKVFRDYVEMKWFDDYTNQIFPLRLRPHERFNIDTRIFLPG